MNCLKKNLLIIKVQVTCKKNYARQKVKKNKDQVYAIKKLLDKIKKLIENKKSKIEENKKIINIVDNILQFNQSGQG